MQAKKNIRLLISFFALALITLGLYFFGNPKSQLEVEKSLFKPKDVSGINKIMLESKSDTVWLDFNGTRWMVNNQYEADQQLIKLLFATLEKAEPKRSVSNNQRDTVSSQLLQTGVLVKLFDNQTLMQAFRAGGNQQKTETYFQKLDDEIPYLITIPGYRLYVSYILELDENGWRDKRIFNFNWRNFKSLTMILPDEPAQNFEVSFKDNFFGIREIASADTTKLNDYLDAISLLTADQFISPGLSTRYDSILKTTPAFSIEVKDISDKTYTLNLYPSGAHDQIIFGRLGPNQGVLFNRNRITPIARKKAFFIAK
jgi:hypothetical protein